VSAFAWSAIIVMECSTLLTLSPYMMRLSEATQASWGKTRWIAFAYATGCAVIAALRILGVLTNLAAFWTYSAVALIALLVFLVSGPRDRWSLSSFCALFSAAGLSSALAFLGRDIGATGIAVTGFAACLATLLLGAWRIRVETRGGNKPAV
jgi:hypothetical protein